MKLKTIFSTLILSAVVLGCDDNTESLGQSIVPDSDIITVDTFSCYAATRSILANDSILSKSSTVYLGRYTDPESNSLFESDFIAQFNCVENYGFPEEGVLGDSCTAITIQLFYESFFGDSLNAMQVEVYPLDRTLEEDTRYYTNLDPTQFYDPTAEPIATKQYVAYDVVQRDTASSSYTPHVSISLPRELGNAIIKQFYDTPDDFANSEAFINNVCKGFYFKSAQGDGTVLYIMLARINIFFDYMAQSSSGANDSIANGVTQFSSTREVLQVNHFNNRNLQPLVDDESCTYLKTPAGIFTEVELPIQEITERDDSLNSVKIRFARYNSNSDSYVQPGTPQTLLMVRKGEMYNFFDNNKTVDNITSYYTTYGSSYNQYEFSNIARLVAYCAGERARGLKSDPDWESKHPDWNRVVLIPVTAITGTSSSSIIGFNHDLAVNSTRLVGGKDKVKMDIVVSRY